jgi:hypothetical protein
MNLLLDVNKSYKLLLTGDAGTAKTSNVLLFIKECKNSENIN